MGGDRGRIRAGEAPGITFCKFILADHWLPLSPRGRGWSRSRPGEGEPLTSPLIRRCFATTPSPARSAHASDWLQLIHAAWLAFCSPTLNVASVLALISS